MDITNYFIIFVFIIIWTFFLLSLMSIFSSFFIIPIYYGYRDLKLKKIRGFIPLTTISVPCILIACWYFNPNVSEEEYNLFMENYDERCEVVEKILNGEIDAGDSWRIELPEKYKDLSVDGTILYDQNEDKKMILFYEHIHYMMGFEDDYRGYAYISDDAKIKDFYVFNDGHSYSYRKIRENWYYVVQH